MIAKHDRNTPCHYRQSKSDEVPRTSHRIQPRSLRVAKGCIIEQLFEFDLELWFDLDLRTTSDGTSRQYIAHHCLHVPKRIHAVEDKLKACCDRGCSSTTLSSGSAVLYSHTCHKTFDILVLRKLAVESCRLGARSVAFVSPSLPKVHCYMG